MKKNIESAKRNSSKNKTNKNWMKNVKKKTSVLFCPSLSPSQLSNIVFEQQQQNKKIVSLFYCRHICSLQPISGLNMTDGRPKSGKANKPNVNSYGIDVYCQNRSMVMFLTCLCAYVVSICLCVCLCEFCMHLCLIHWQSWLCSMCGNKNSEKWIYLSFESCYLVRCYIIAHKKSSIIHMQRYWNGK